MEYIFFFNGFNGLGIYDFSVPYEIIANDIKQEYLPISKEIERYIGEKKALQIDINGDGVLDRIAYENGEVVINGVISVLTEGGIELAEDEKVFDEGFLKLVRDKDGISRLEREIEVCKKISEDVFIRQEERNYKLVYRIEGERAVFESAEFITEE